MIIGARALMFRVHTGAVAVGTAARDAKIGMPSRQ